MALYVGERETTISPCGKAFLAFPQKLKCAQSYEIPWRSFKVYHYPKRGFFVCNQSPFNPMRMESGEKKKDMIICEDTDWNNIFQRLKRIKTELKSLENEKPAWCSGSLVVFKWLCDAYTLI